MPRSRAVARTSRAVALLSTAALVMAVPVVLPTVAAAAEPTTVTVAGSLQSELGCSGDWQPDCAETDLAFDAAQQVWSASFTLPAGSYEFKTAIDHSWTENYGAGGAANGSNIPLVLEHDLAVTFSWDPVSHRTAVRPTDQLSGVTSQDRQLAGSSLRDDLTKERFYFVMADRFANGDTTNDLGGLAGDRLTTGYDPADKGFYHGGDLAGITANLEYLKGLGTTSIWMTPSFKNRPVQGVPGNYSAGYHGYWITDFTQIDPHLGTNAELKTLVDQAHAKGMKVFFDIITNHTADVISTPSAYVSKATRPYTDDDGNAFNDLDYAAGDTFPELDPATSFPYVPTFPNPGDESVKQPEWLNEPIYYHNRGNASFDGTEGDIYGDFVGLDDLFTENPTVRDGMIDVYKAWAEFGIDGFRIDTVKHVNMEFWQKFAPEILETAAAAAKPDFFMFGEVYDTNPAATSRYTTEGDLQATLDFGFQNSATQFAKGAGTTGMRDFFASDDYYTDANSNVYSSPTFLGNHDMGRIGNFLSQGGTVTGDELLQRDQLAHSLMYLSRGQPVVYYGDEQGFVGDGGDKDARQDMFASQVGSYNDDDLIGTDATTATDSYNTSHPLYQFLAQLSALRQANPALADGAQIHRYASNGPGIYAFSRIDANQQVEYVVALNNSTAPASAEFATYNRNTQFQTVWPAGAAAPKSTAEGRVGVTVPPLSAVVFKAPSKLKKQDAAPSLYFNSPAPGDTVGGRAPIGVAVPADGFNQVTILARPAGAPDWTVLGTDDNAPYRVYQDVSDVAKGTLMEYRAVLKDHSGNYSIANGAATVGDPAPPPSGGGQGEGGSGEPVEQPDAVSVPGNFNNEVGCTPGPLSTDGDWNPPCDQIQLTLDPSGHTWSKTINIPAGTYQHKVAINKTWDENYGANGAFNGANITLNVPADATPADGTPVTFFYDHRTHWVTSNASSPIVVAAGSFQSELGCAADWSPDCIASLLQDPDGDGTYVWATTEIPAGNYEVKAAHNLSWAESYGAGGLPTGGNIGFTVPENGKRVQFTYVLSTHVLTITTGATFDLAKAQANWLQRGLVAWNLPAGAKNWTYRLYSAPEGGMTVDAEAILGGSSMPLTFDAAGLPPDVAAKWPHLAGYDALRLPDKQAKDKRFVSDLLRGQVAVVAFDELGRVVNATGLQIAGVLDDLYAGATTRQLGPWFAFGTPVLSLWAPTAKRVTLVVDPPGDAPSAEYSMSRDSDGVWTRWGRAGWMNGTYTYEVEVYVPATDAVEENVVTDPYSVALTTNSDASVIADLTATRLTPNGWYDLEKPALDQPESSTIYELHIRDFSIGDPTVQSDLRGTYLAFTDRQGAGMRHLRQLARAGLNTVHLLPAFDIATIEEDRSAQQTPACALESLPPNSEQQQACVTAVADTDGFNWGYDPLHYTTPEGSYATDPEGAQRTREFRRMVGALNRSGLRVVMDVVYNHTAASGQADNSILDRIVPGYYQRLNAEGAVETSTCCANTASENAMMEKLMVDSLVTWAKQYKVDGFRFDLMGHHSKQNMLNVRAALDRLTLARDGVDGKNIFLYGEGWNFGEVADDARFVQATQANMGGTGIATFSDRLRDAVRGGGPFDADPRIQGFGSGLASDPNGAPVNGNADARRARLLLYQDQIKVGLTGNLEGYTFEDRTGVEVTGAQVDYNGSPAGYTEDPSEVITYVDAHDNETLFDSLTYKLPRALSMADRVRMNTISLATTALSQGPLLWHAGNDLLRSKSLDRNSYNSGDWFNRIDWTGRQNTFGSGLPPATDNSAKWDYMRPLLADPALLPRQPDMQAATFAAQDLLELRFSSPLFRLGTAEAIQHKLSFPDGGPDQTAGVIVMAIDDTVGTDVDPDVQRLLVVFNASSQPQQIAGAEGMELSEVQADGRDPVVQETVVEGDTATVPGRTVAVLVLPQT